MSKWCYNYVTPASTKILTRMVTAGHRVNMVNNWDDSEYRREEEDE